MESGDTEAGFAKSDHVIEGEIRVGAQEHFYLETIAHRVIPKNEDGCVEVFSSTQAPSDEQVVLVVVVFFVFFWVGVWCSHPAQIQTMCHGHHDYLSCLSQM